MLLSILPLRASLAFWFAAIPGPSRTAEPSLTIDPTAPVTIALYDENHRETATITINRDGSVDRATAREIKRLFRCKRTERQHKMDKGLLAMLADVGAHWPGKTIEYVSGYRAMHRESRTSPHRAARALDFRIQGVSVLEVRDYMWKNFHDVGVGWYPVENFVHMDHRPGVNDCAWTFRHGRNGYHPFWAERIRPTTPEQPKSKHLGVGV